MKKYNVEVKTQWSECWDCDAVPDYVEADNEEEAIDFAIDYLRECIINNCGDPDELNDWTLRAIEIE